MHRPLRTLWGLVAIGGATAVGITTHDAGFTVITFLGGLALPRILGLAGPGWRHHGRRGWDGACAGRGQKTADVPQSQATQTV